MPARANRVGAAAGGITASTAPLRCGATGKTQRLIVEFAIENAQVVQRRRELQARSRAGALKKEAHDAGEHEDAFEEEPKGKGKGKDKGKGKAKA